MDEARRIKSILYPLSRDLRNLHTFVANVNSILQAEPDRFAVAAPPGLASIRNTLRSLSKSSKAMLEVNDITVSECEMAERLSSESGVALLKPVPHLHRTALSLQEPIDQVYRMVLRLNGYLSPTFVFTVACMSNSNMMMKDVISVSQRMSAIKKAVSRLTDYEMTAGLPANIEHSLSLLIPQLGVIEQEASDIALKMSQLMASMNPLMELSSRLEPVVRMGAALDNTIQDLIPSMSVLKHVGQVLIEFRYDRISGSSQAQQLNEALAGLNLPTDILSQLEYRLQRHADQYVFPVLQPLAEITDQIKVLTPDNQFLSNMESDLTIQQGRFSNMERLMKTVFDRFEALFEEYKKLTHAA